MKIKNKLRKNAKALLLAGIVGAIGAGCEADGSGEKRAIGILLKAGGIMKGNPLGFVAGDAIINDSNRDERRINVYNNVSPQNVSEYSSQNSNVNWVRGYPGGKVVAGDGSCLDLSGPNYTGEFRGRVSGFEGKKVQLYIYDIDNPSRGANDVAAMSHKFVVPSGTSTMLFAVDSWEIAKKAKGSRLQAAVLAGSFLTQQTDGYYFYIKK